MTGDDIRHNDVGIFQQWDFGYFDRGKIVLIEKVGEEEGTGAWAIKKIVFLRERSLTQTEVPENIDWDDPVIELRSSNPRIKSWQLDPTGQYRVRGYFVRVLRPEDVVLVSLGDLMPGSQRGEPDSPL